MNNDNINYQRREMFAAHALTGFLSQRVASEDDEDRSLTFLAQLSFRMADLMIGEADRDKEGGPG